MEVGRAKIVASTYATIKLIEGRLKVHFRSKSVHLDKHLAHKQTQKYYLCIFYKHKRDLISTQNHHASMPKTWSNLFVCWGSLTTDARSKIVAIEGSSSMGPSDLNPG